MDSLIRLRQLNLPDLSGYISQVVPKALAASGLSLSGLALVPTGSGLYDLGAINHFFDALYANDVQMPSGSGIHFGNVLFSVYQTGSGMALQFGNYTMTSSAQGLSIIGPSGAQGLTGIPGPSGASGTSISGVTKSGIYMNVWKMVHLTQLHWYRVQLARQELLLQVSFNLALLGSTLSTLMELLVMDSRLVERKDRRA
jgi:hypothetical protein